MFKLLVTGLCAVVVSACAFNPTYYDELRQSEHEQHRFLGN